MLKVLPVTSSAPSAPRVSPPSKNRMPPVEVIDPESSCRALESVRLEALVSIIEPAAVIVSVFGRVKPALPSASVSLLPFSSSVPNVTFPALRISVSALSLKIVFAPVLKSFKFMLPPLASRVPDVRSSVPCQPLQLDPEFATNVPETLRADPSFSSELLTSSLPVSPTVPPWVRLRMPPPCASSPFSVKDPIKETLPVPEISLPPSSMAKVLSTVRLLDPLLIDSPFLIVSPPVW